MTESAMVEQNARAAQGAAATPLVEADRVGLGPATGPGAIHAVEIGDPEGAPVVFGHGWARTHADFIPIAELLARQGARSILLDFPGFGESPRPSETWGAAAYADAIRAHLADAFRLTRFTWVGHSFGARVGLSLAARPASAVESPVERLFIIAGAGVARPRPVSHRLRGKINGWRFRMRKAMARNEAELIALERRFGSADYVQSRALGLRDIFVKIVGEDQSDALPRITAPTTLIYGGRDTETPPELGRRMQALIPGARYVECPEFDHLSILSRGRHQIATLISEQI